MTKEDYVIILGDFGFIWKLQEDKTEQYWKQIFNSKHFTTLFIDGNHDNHHRLNNDFPIEMWNGGKIHRITDNIIHLMRGQVFTINNIKFFTMGGAESIDKAYRTEGLSWWRNEIPSYNEINEGIDNLKQYGWKVDYVLTHTAPRHIMQEMVYEHIITYIGKDPTTKALQEITAMINYNHWFFGHFHADMDIDNQHTCLYNRIIEIASNNKWQWRKEN